MCPTASAPRPPCPGTYDGRGTDCSSFYRSCRLIWNLFPFSPQASRIRCGLGCAEVLTTRVSFTHEERQAPRSATGQAPMRSEKPHRTRFTCQTCPPGFGAGWLLCQAPWSCEWETRWYVRLTDFRYQRLKPYFAEFLFCLLSLTVRVISEI